MKKTEAAVAADFELKSFFDEIDMARRGNKQKAFLTCAFGGAPNYFGKNMRDAREHPVRKVMNSKPFDVIMKYLGDALRELNVSKPVKNDAPNL